MSKHCATCDQFTLNQRLTKELREARAEAEDWKRRAIKAEGKLETIVEQEDERKIQGVPK